MTGNTVVFVTDQRQENLAAYLPGRKRRLDWRGKEPPDDAVKILEESRWIVLPIPVSKIEKNKWLTKMLKQKLITGKAAGWKIGRASCRERV